MSSISWMNTFLAAPLTATITTGKQKHPATIVSASVINSNERFEKNNREATPLAGPGFRSTGAFLRHYRLYPGFPAGDRKCHATLPLYPGPGKTAAAPFDLEGYRR